MRRMLKLLAKNSQSLRDRLKKDSVNVADVNVQVNKLITDTLVPLGIYAAFWSVNSIVYSKIGKKINGRKIARIAKAARKQNKLVKLSSFLFYSDGRLIPFYEKNRLR